MAMCKRAFKIRRHMRAFERFHERCGLPGLRTRTPTLCHGFNKGNR
jgi:hypothetical protein